jgi:hypothetical protein
VFRASDESLNRLLLQAQASFPDDVAKRYFAQASFVLSKCMSQDWWEHECRRHESEQSIRKSLGPFLRDWTHAQFHIVALADAIFSLRKSIGWDDYRARCVKQTDSGKMGREFDEVYSELIVARLLQQLGAHIEFKEPSGKKGNDYDLVVELAGVTVAVESKLRLTLEVDYLRTLENTFESARKQLPRDRPSMIVAYVPHAWLEAESEPQVVNRIADFFRRSKRVNAVCLLWESKVLVTNGTAFLRHAAVAKNESARLVWSPNFDILERIDSVWSAIPGKNLTPSFSSRM